MVGEAPPSAVIKSLAASLASRLVDETFHASSFGEVEALAAHEDVASGVLAVRLRADRDVWLFWFRPAKARRVTWAGEPRKVVDVAHGVARLSPRESFKAWTEEQRGRAEPWTLADLACARRVRESLSDVLLQLFVHAAHTAQLDVARMKRAEAALAHARDVAEATSRELEAFAYSIAHDLRAPLRAMNAFAQLLLDSYGEKLDPEGRDWLGEILFGAERMAALIDALLSLSQVASRDMKRESIDLSAIVRESTARLFASDPGRVVEVDVQDGVLADVDRTLAHALIDNLMGNAWKFTSKVPAAHIEFGATTIEGALTCFVRDNGAGFDAAFAGKLFAPFRRLHTVEDFPGTGIGLATVQRIVHRHGGRVWAEGSVNHGATFYFTCPAV